MFPKNLCGIKGKTPPSPYRYLQDFWTHPFPLRTIRFVTETFCFRTLKRMALRLSTRSEVAIPQRRKTAQKSLTRNGKRTTSPIKSRKRTRISNKYISPTKCVFRGHTVSESRQYLGCVNE